ncbi:helix-turn-helix domain-containing protein [Nocardia arthritidis]|uniref:Helix-turn-helix domain-containing protein n=1 Tax=Nocardia arthritidis TaxID=228602 RepID=A0A6G9YQX7_9NOCA|nr:helix-turn-helix domain-containing protein [Nocardia arthritidis]QIS15624.1 hypothetical protein F5544_39015 [Nocardia arthritidis]
MGAVGRPERPLDPSEGPRENFAYQLRQLRKSAGEPKYRAMAQLGHYSANTLSEAAGGKKFPSWEVTRAFVVACHGDEREWRERWNACRQALQQRGAGPRSDARPAMSRGEQVSGAGRWSWLRWPAFGFAAIAMAILLVYDHRPSAVSHSTFIGQADFGAYCQAQSYTTASLTGHTAYDWKCTGPQERSEPISAVRACRWQYHSATATGRYDDINIPSSWQCWDHVDILGRVDLDAYCRAQGFVRATLDGQTVDTWSCLAPDSSHSRIDPDSACRWRYGAKVLIANPGVYDEPWDRWDCWA